MSFPTIPVSQLTDADVWRSSFPLAITGHLDIFCHDSYNLFTGSKSIPENVT